MDNRDLGRLVRILGVIACLSCSPEGVIPERSGGPPHGVEREDRVALSQEEIEEFGVEIAVAGAGLVPTTVELPGEIRPNEDLVAHIVPRFPGIVKSVRKAVGDPVQKGDVLAVVESSESLSRYSIQSLLEGLVIARHVSVGEAVNSERELFVVADLSTVWVDFQAFQKHLPLLAIGQRIQISAGHGLPEAEALVSYISPVVDGATRTATIRAFVDNADGRWRPGLFVTGRVETANEEVSIVVPDSAIQNVGGSPVVFVSVEDGFAPRPVRIGRRGPHRVEISEGLDTGERFVSSGGFILKAELERGKLGEEHGH